MVSRIQGEERRKKRKSSLKRGKTQPVMSKEQRQEEKVYCVHARTMNKS